MIDIVRQTIIQFCLEFIENPYLCYTEHGQHAMFYTMLYNDPLLKQQNTTWKGKKLCVIQKEYPTAGCLGKSRRQHWDIAVIKTPPESIVPGKSSYDYLKLAAAVEFGMNEATEHLKDDLDRLCHSDSNLEQGFIVHLYRLSQPAALFSKRDCSSRSTRITTLKEVVELSIGKQVDIYYGLTGGVGEHKNGLWHVHQGQESSLKRTATNNALT